MCLWLNSGSYLCPWCGSHVRDSSPFCRASSIVRSPGLCSSSWDKTISILSHTFQAVTLRTPSADTISSPNMLCDHCELPSYHIITETTVSRVLLTSVLLFTGLVIAGPINDPRKLLIFQTEAVLFSHPERCPDYTDWVGLSVMIIVPSCSRLKAGRAGVHMYSALPRFGDGTEINKYK